MSIGTLIVGLGQIGMGYDLHLNPEAYVYSHARAFSRHPAFHLVAGVDPVQERRETFTRRYGSPAYPDLTEALRHHQPGLVVIATPTPSHADIVRHVLSQSRPSALLCEKPLSYSTGDAEDMVRLCAAQGIHLYVNYMRRADPGAIEVRRRIESGIISTPVKGIAWYTKGFLNNGSHLFDLLECWLGPMQKVEVLASGRLWNDVDPEPDVRIDFAGGQVVFLSSREECFSHYTIELLAPNGRLYYARGGSYISWQSSLQDSRFPGYTTLSAEPEIIPSGMDRYQWHVADQLAAALSGMSHRLSSGADALAAVKNIRMIIDHGNCDD